MERGIANNMTGNMMYIAYYRTKKPKSRNFDLNRQKADVRRIAEPGEEFIEVERPRQYTRPTLETAIARAKEIGAVLVLAKFDRLIHNATVTHSLMESGIDFICCDNPNANKKTIHMLAAVADEETREKAMRAKDTFARMKAEGKALGSAREGHWKGREHKRGWKQAVKVATENRIKKTANRYQYLMPDIKQMREEGKSLAEIVDWLNGNGHLTTALKPFTQTAVWRIIKRYLGEEYLGPIKSKDHPLSDVVAQNEGALRVK